VLTPPVAAYLTKVYHYVQNGILNIKMGENHTTLTRRISFLRQNGNVIKTKSETPQEIEGVFFLSK
jgi:hypothetical protein